MFALRGIAVSLTFFVVIYCFLSALVAVLWRGLRSLGRSDQGLANLLLWLRVLPLFASLIVTLAFVVPSFQLLEPRASGEGVGTMPITLGLGALFLIAWGCRRVAGAQTRTSRIVARWLAGSQPLGIIAHALAFRVGRGAPPLTLVGLRKPRVLVSDSTVELLTAEELEVALRHEQAHMDSYDNLKKLIFRFCPFPGMAPLEAAWSQAAELAADEDAISDVNDALNLAAALVKLSRLVPVESAPVCTVGFVTGSLNERVNRLLAWDEAHKPRSANVSRWAMCSSFTVVVFCAFVNYGPLLSMTHEATEWLVR